MRVHSPAIPHESRPEDVSTAVAPIPREVREADLWRAAFRDLHAASLHGFALLVSGGDRPRAERAATMALLAGVRRVEELRHPERAAAWLRAEALRDLRRRGPARRSSAAERESALRNLGASPEVVAALRVLREHERAALAAATVERFEAIDVETILGRSPSGARRAVSAARQRFLEAVRRATRSQRTNAPADPADGLLARRIRETTIRALGSRAPGTDR